MSLFVMLLIRICNYTKGQLTSSSLSPSSVRHPDYDGLLLRLLEEYCAPPENGSSLPKTDKTRRQDDSVLHGGSFVSLLPNEGLWITSLDKMTQLQPFVVEARGD